MIQKYKINKINVFAFKGKKEFLSFIRNEKGILIAINAEKILNHDSKLHEIINNNIGYPDGIGAVMALKQKGSNAEKIPGAEFWLDIIHEFYKDKSFYFVGSTQEVIDKTIDKLKVNFKGINIVGFRNGFFNLESKEELKIELKRKRPDIIFVAQGSPKQEYLMRELLTSYSALYMGLGGSFDVYSDKKKRAPKFFLRYNLEWFYRLLMEPTRIKRQLNLFKFMYLLLLKKL